MNSTHQVVFVSKYCVQPTVSYFASLALAVEALNYFMALGSYDRAAVYENGSCVCLFSAERNPQRIAA
ncbi:MAG TPA: hypothetical protein VM120_07130 [Bryobacteraceae bacterium]|nr:hypothetical protein [Bryobacteraceae bacterium]